MVQAPLNDRSVDNVRVRRNAEILRDSSSDGEFNSSSSSSNQPRNIERTEEEIETLSA